MRDSRKFHLPASIRPTEKVALLGWAPCPTMGSLPATNKFWDQSSHKPARDPGPHREEMVASLTHHPFFQLDVSIADAVRRSVQEKQTAFRGHSCIRGFCCPCGNLQDSRLHKRLSGHLGKPCGIPDEGPGSVFIWFPSLLAGHHLCPPSEATFPSLERTGHA